MKKKFLPVVAFAAFSLLFSCKGKNKEAGSDSGSAATTTADAGKSAPSNEPKTYTVTFSPDTVLLGKDKAVAVKIKDAKAIELQDPDGKDQGIQLTFSLDVTNKHPVGGNSIFFRTDNFRLQLDNGNSITENNGGAESVDAESTKELKEIVYKVPAGNKPKTLNLFHDETRVSVSVELK